VARAAKLPLAALGAERHGLGRVVVAEVFADPGFPAWSIRRRLSAALYTAEFGLSASHARLDRLYAVHDLDQGLVELLVVGSVVCAAMTGRTYRDHPPGVVRATV
jgi:hypothetical protein